MYKPSLINTLNYQCSRYLPDSQQTSIQPTSFQLTRRAALKLMIGSAAGVVLPSATTVAAHPMSRSTHQSDVEHSMAKLKVVIITGQSAPEDTVLVSTTADHPVSLKRFMPGTLVVEDRILDLNQALVSGALEVVPGSEKSVLLPSLLTSRRRPSDTDLREYLMVDSAVEDLGVASDAELGAVSEQVSTPAAATASTQIITLQALVDTDGMAVVYVPSVADVAGLA